jgi:AraC-like DNA-binding protein
MGPRDSADRVGSRRDAFEDFLAAAVVTRCLDAASGRSPGCEGIDEVIDRLTHVLRSAARSVTEARRARSSALPRHKLRAVSAYVESNLEAPLRVSAMAAHVGVSPFHFSRQFRAATGLAPHQYVLHARMRRAAHLLVVTEKNVSSIAVEVGCSDQSHFASTFRRLFGCAPRVFRARAGDVRRATTQDQSAFAPTGSALLAEVRTMNFETLPVGATSSSQDEVAMRFASTAAYLSECGADA